MLASQVEMHRTYIGAVERGERNLTLQTVERLAEQLDVHPLQLILDPDLVDFGPGLTAVAPVPVVTLSAADGSADTDPAAVRPRSRSSRPRVDRE